MKKAVKCAIEIAKWKRFHLVHKRLARSQLLMALESGHSISVATKRQCEEYSMEVLGSMRFSPWLVFYSAIAGEFREGWIPDNFFGSHIVPSLQGAYGKISDLRALGVRLFGDHHFCDLVYFVNGVFFHNEDRISVEAVPKLLFQNDDLVIFKADNTSQSLGVEIFNAENFCPEKVRAIGNGVFQRFLKQPSVLDKFAPGAVATLRLNTIINKKGDAEVRSGHIRFAMKGDKFLKASNQIRVPVDLANGRFWDYGYTVNWLRVEKHPDTLVGFAGLAIPSFASCKEIVLRLHRSFPLVQMIGWDLAVSVDGKCYVLEWNGWNNGLPFSEAVQGPCYADLGWEKLPSPPGAFSPNTGLAGLIRRDRRESLQKSCDT